ncbi:phage portal protein [Aporhodopirellula aestuarii]|uniref:Phage portal protein n=1 Tax=Aporhodopirellula aestuarii TaxID=2950107 RepID=A0ABT0TYH4_9BACT|nr:phage portal protein [Aporhodopirellula aestuarii]MCM2369648.1 phage portal protein [Aporhodopirellula aestuarii]
MSFIRNPVKWVKDAFTYDALTPQGRRKSVSSQVYREDYHHRGAKHRSLQANASDLQRNMSVLAWAVRQHLSYTSAFTFNCQTDSNSLNDRIETLMKEDSLRSQADVAGKFNREKLWRIAEARRVLDGDCLLVKTDSGQLQGIQADLIRDPSRPAKGEEWINGVLVSETGRPLRYCVHSRSGYMERVNERQIDARNVIHYGFFGERFAADAVRGVSPLTASLAPLRDLKESVELAQARAKVAQIFAMAITREPDEFRGDPDDEEGSQEDYSMSFDRPQFMQLSPGDDAKMLESRQPSTEFQSFTRLCIMLSLKALDLPLSLFDGERSTFHGGRAEWLNYVHSCQEKREDQVTARSEYTVWKLRQWVRDDRLFLPKGMRVSDVDFTWIPKNSTPWWDKSRETRGDREAVRCGFDNPMRIAAEKGFVWKDNIDATAEAIRYAKEKGVPLDFAPDDTNQPQVTK